jgi:hypothetical protein
MTGAETTGLSFGISENLQHKRSDQILAHINPILLSSEEVPEPYNRVVRVFHELMFCTSADVLHSGPFVRFKYRLRY